MLNSGPSGFRNAAVTKTVLVTTVGMSLLLSVTKLQRHFELQDISALYKLQLWRVVTNHMFFSGPGEILFGSLLIYHFRLFERQLGSAKFAGFTFISFAVASMLQLMSFFLFSNMKHLAPGPYAFIFSCFVQFWNDIPSLNRFKILGVRSNDKLFTYILGLQLMFSHWPGSFIASIIGIVSGVIYRSEVLNLQRFQFPEAVNNFASRFLLPLISSPNRVIQRNPVMMPVPPTRNNVQPNRVPPPNNVQHLQDNLNAFFQNNVVPQQPVQPSEDAIQALESMGFQRDQVIAALLQTNNDVQLATNILLDN